MIDLLEVLTLIGWVLEFTGIGLLLWIARTMHLEKELRRSSKVIFSGLVVFAMAAAILMTDFPGKIIVLFLGEALVLLLCLLVFLPIGKVELLEIPEDLPRFDERDIMFARAGYVKGTPNYLDYYARHPELQDYDDRIRSLPGICSPGSATYDPLHARLAGAAFHFLSDIHPFTTGSISPEKGVTDTAKVTKVIKGLTQYYGAKIVGITETRPYHFYSQRGRHPKNYGDEIKPAHKYAIAFAVEMDYWMVKGAPQAQVVVESARQYVEAAKIGMMLSYFIRELGFDARNHMDGNYLVCAPLIAHDAGIGELSRMGIIITQDYGPRVRLGVVTTDLPLLPDHPVAFGVQDSCRSCRKCAKNCPSQAISADEKAPHDGVLKWKINQELCYEFWCKVGTDCAVCLNTCPYSKPNTLLHKIFRYSLRNSAFTRRAMVHLDDFVYGRRVFSSQKPDWM